MTSIELRDFLRSRRARVSPQDVGLPSGPSLRRVPGLRREEVAQLAGVSVDYYVRLERGRDINVSDSVLAAVARALRLDDTERGHLFALARPQRGQHAPVAPRPQQVRPALLRLLATWPRNPAVVLGDRLDVLAANDLATALFSGWADLPDGRRNVVSYMFTAEARKLYLDWPEAARSTVNSLRLYAGSHPHDARVRELVADLSARDGDFRAWWADHDVLRHTHGAKRLHHPVVGDLTLGYEAFIPKGEPDQTLGVYLAEPGTSTEDGLRQLAQWIG